MVPPVLHAGTPHRVSLRGFERSHPQLVCVLIREMGSEARASLSSPVCSEMPVQLRSPRDGFFVFILDFRRLDAALHAPLSLV